MAGLRDLDLYIQHVYPDIDLDPEQKRRVESILNRLLDSDLSDEQIMDQLDSARDSVLERTRVSSGGGGLRNLNAFIKHMLPDLDDDLIAQIDSTSKRLIESRIQKLFDSRLSIEEIMDTLDTVRNSAVAQQVANGRMRATDAVAILGIASFTLAAVVAGALASDKMKKLYERLMDSASEGLSSLKWEDDAPDKDDVIPFFYDTGAIEALITGFNSVRAKVATYLKEYQKKSPDPLGNIPFYNDDYTKKLITNLNKFARDAAVYVNSQKPTFDAADFPPPRMFGTRTDTEEETLPPISKKEARAREAIQTAVNIETVNVTKEKDIPAGNSFLNSDTFGGMLNGIGNLAGISTAAYLHYKSITQPQVEIPFPVFPTFGTATPPVNNPPPVVEATDYTKTASDMFKQAKSVYDIYKEYNNKTTEGVKENISRVNQTDVAPEAEKAQPAAEKEAETLPQTTEVVTEVEKPPQTTEVVTETETLPPTPEVVAEETLLPTTEVVADVETPQQTAEVEPEAENVEEQPVQNEGSDVDNGVAESVVSDTIISRWMEPNLNRVLAKGLSQSKAGMISPILSSIVASVIASNKSLANATSSVLLESVVAAGLGKIMPTSFATSLAAPFVSALAAAVRVNATVGSVADSTMEAAFLPVFTILLTGALTPHMGFAMGSVAATMGAKMAYDAAKSTAAVTVDVIKKVEEIRQELKKKEEEEAAKRIKIEQEQPSLRAMVETPDHILEENIIKNLTQEQAEEESLSGAAPSGSPPSGEEIQRDRERSQEIQRDTSLGKAPRVQINSKKRSRESLDLERVFSRDTSLNGLPISWSMQNIMVRDDDQLRVPIA